MTSTSIFGFGRTWRVANAKKGRAHEGGTVARDGLVQADAVTKDKFFSSTHSISRTLQEILVSVRVDRQRQVSTSKCEQCDNHQEKLIQAILDYRSVTPRSVKIIGCTWDKIMTPSTADKENWTTTARMELCTTRRL